jgi:hypothetical protein
MITTYNVSNNPPLKIFYFVQKHIPAVVGIRPFGFYAMVLQ